MKKKYIIISIISLLIITIGASYAYFTGMIIGEGSPITVKANSLAVIFTDTSEISGNEITPGWEVSKTFTVENKSGSVFYYDINIEDLINTFVTTGYLQYKITSTDGGYNMEEYMDIPKSEIAERTNLIKNIQIENGSIHTYKVEFRYLNSEEDQSDDMGASFSGSLSITESNIIITKYKVKNVIQDTIPNKEEPYIVDKVTCSNNAKGTWNEELEKVELESAVTQTICIVEFKEGNTVTLEMEDGSGSVVAPSSKVVGRIGKTEFQININNGYDITKGTVSCNNGSQININGTTVTITNITKDKTICTISPKKMEFTVTYDQNGGTGVNPTSNKVIFGSKYILPTTNPIKTGYDFVGWFTASSGGTEVTTNTEVTRAENHTLYAHYTAKTITISLDRQSGSGGTGAVYYRYDTATYYTNSNLTGAITKITVPTRDGYTFNGYYSGKNGSGTQYINASGTLINNLYNLPSNTTLYASWTIKSFNVTLKVTNGTPSNETKSVNYNGDLTFTVKANSGYKLEAETISCSGGSYNNSGTVTFNNVKSNLTCTITLAPLKKTFTITSSSCPDTINNNSGACYIIAHELGGRITYANGLNSQPLNDWNNTATYNGKVYTNCEIVSHIKRVGTKNGGCLDGNAFAKPENLLWADYPSGNVWNTTYGYDSYAWCSVTLTCDN